MLVINLKAYREAIGERALKILDSAEKVFEETKIKIAIAPQYTDIYPLAKSSKNILIFAQHMDPIEPGAHTGWVLPEAIKEAGAKGVILNHSEKQMKIEDIEKAIMKAKKLDLITIVCVNDPLVAKAVSTFEPDYIAVEPPELIGTGISVSKVKPEIIKKAVEWVKEENYKIKVLVGAGISNRDDVKRSIELGADGVLVASAVAKAKDPYKKIKELAEGFMI